MFNHLQVVARSAAGGEVCVHLINWVPNLPGQFKMLELKILNILHGATALEMCLKER